MNNCGEYSYIALVILCAATAAPPVSGACPPTAVCAESYADQADDAPSPLDQIPAGDRCNREGEDGSLAEQIGAQMRRSGSEWASTCLKHFGSAGSDCEVAYPGDTPFTAVPLGVPSLVCPNVAACDRALGRVEWHAENKFARKCTFDQWNLAWRWIQSRAGSAAPPDCEITDFQPRFWGVYSCYERHFVHPMMIDMLNKLRDYATPNPPMTPACEGAIATRLWFRLASDWVRFGVDDPCRGLYRDREMRKACGTGTPAPMIDEATLDSWCGEYRSFLLPVFEGVRGASGKPY